MYVLYIFVVLNVSSFLEACNDQIRKASDSVLCRNCGSEFFSTDAIITKLSPISIYSYNDTVFNSDPILVQLLPEDLNLQLPIITTESSACLGVGEWQEDDFWFPGYRWKPCGCSKCGAFIGWLYETIDPFSVVIPEIFFGLVPDRLVSKNRKYNYYFWGSAICVLSLWTCITFHHLIFIWNFSD